MLFRLLMLLVTLELTGIAPVVERAIGGDEAAAECGLDCSDCPVKSDGKPCPPGCPNCHCSVGGVALAPVSEGAIQLAPAADETLHRPYEAGVPHAPAPLGVYRPPRSCPRTVMGRAA